jgi:hypothetical protein
MTPAEMQTRIQQIATEPGNAPDGYVIIHRSTLRYSVERIKQLERALGGAKVGHVFVADDSYYSCGAIGQEEQKVFTVGCYPTVLMPDGRSCDCDAHKHNVAIETALTTMPEGFE